MSSERGRPRSPEVTAAVAGALGTLLAENEYARVSVDQVASTAGVSKAAIYRRWASKGEMVFALVLHGAELSPQRFDRGGLADDLLALTSHVVQVLSTPQARNAIPGVLADLQLDPALASRFRSTFVLAELEVVTALLDRAAARHELSRPADGENVLAQLLGMTFAWLFLLPSTDGPPADLITRVRDCVLSTL